MSARYTALGIARATGRPILTGPVLVNRIDRWSENRGYITCPDLGPDRTARLWRRRHRRAPSLGRFLIPPLCGAVRIPDPWRPHGR